MQRREFITALLPQCFQPGCRVQRKSISLDGSATSPGTAKPTVLTNRLKELEYSEGKNLKIEWRLREGHLVCFGME